MVVGICRLELYLPECGSLKNKRSVLKSITTRIRNKFNVSVSELDQNELWQKAGLGIAIITNESRYANQVLSKAIQFVEGDGRVHLLDYTMEML